MKRIKRIGVIGAGTMGHGIALVFAMAGFDAVFYDIKKSALKNGITKIDSFLKKSIKKRKITNNRKKQILSKIKGTITLNEVKNCHLLIEAIPENFNLKKKLFRELGKICSRDVIFASNTSTISINKLAQAINRQDKFIGMHFFNPVPLMKLVEIVKSKRTSKEIINRVTKLSKKLGKIPIVVNDSPGFASNRILFPMINEAIYCLEEGVAEKEAIDNIMKIGMNHPMGPLELADLIGLDTCLLILEELQKGFSDSKYKPCPLLKKMIKKGYLGKKAGKGFYNYKK